MGRAASLRGDDLPRAAAAETASLMLSDLLAKTLPPELATTVVARAEGNPFFVEELVATLMDRGVIERANGSWRVHDIPAGFEIPDSIRSVLAARIDLLGPAEKEALQAASVIGRIFWTGPLYELIGDVIPDLRVLEERDFIRRRSGSSLAGEQEYTIKHTLTSEVAYNSLPRARRARLHAAFAAWLERVGEGRDEWAALLAHHYAEAARPEDADLAWAGAQDELEQLQEKAVRWLTRAGKLAVDRYEIDEALELFHRALGLTSSSETAAGLWLAIGNATALRYDGAGFANAMERALELSDDPAVRAKTYSELAFQTGIRIGMWTTRPEVTTVDAWIERALAVTGEKSAERARTLIALANTHPDNGEHARRASALADELGDPELRSWAWMARTAAAFEATRFEESLTWAQRRFDLEDQITDPDHLVEMRENALPQPRPSPGCARSGASSRSTRSLLGASRRTTRCTASPCEPSTSSWRATGRGSGPFSRKSSRLSKRTGTRRASATPAPFYFAPPRSPSAATRRAREYWSPRPTRPA